VLPLGLVSLGHVNGGPVNIGVAAGQLPRVDHAACVVVGPEPAVHRGRCAANATSKHGASAASRPTQGGSPCCWWTEGFCCCELALPTRQEAACRWHDVELSACCAAACSTDKRILQWSSSY
jgi:hypothetical protein